jgi:hypothetical protein
MLQSVITLPIREGVTPRPSILSEDVSASPNVAVDLVGAANTGRDWTRRLGNVTRPGGVACGKDGGPR